MPSPHAQGGNAIGVLNQPCGVSHTPVTRTTSASSQPLTRFLPAQLIKARAKAMNANYCQDLTHPARMALWGILAFINIRDTNQPIFPTREVLRGETMLGSLPTLYRALALLEQHGYIYREQSRRQSKIDYGQYSISRIWITEKPKPCST